MEILHVCNVGRQSLGDVLHGDRDVPNRSQVGPRGVGDGDDDGAVSHQGDEVPVAGEDRLGDGVLVVEGDHHGNDWGLVVVLHGEVAGEDLGGRSEGYRR